MILTPEEIKHTIDWEKQTEQLIKNIKEKVFTTDNWKIWFKGTGENERDENLPLIEVCQRIRQNHAYSLTYLNGLLTEIENLPERLKLKNDYLTDVLKRKLWNVQHLTSIISFQHSEIKAKDKEIERLRKLNDKMVDKYDDIMDSVNEALKKKFNKPEPKPKKPVVPKTETTEKEEEKPEEEF